MPGRAGTHGQAAAALYPVDMNAPSATPPRSLLTRLAFDREGHLRSWRMVGIAAAAAMLLTLGGLVAAILAGAGTPEALPVWIVIAFFAIKLPILGLLWWLLGRSEHDGQSDELPDDRAILAIMRLREAAATAGGDIDAWDRLDALAAEAGYLATHSSPGIADEAARLSRELLERRDRLPTPPGLMPSQ